MAFGAVRRAYKAASRFFADDPPGANQIRWYYVPDGTPIYDGWTVFWPRVDVPPNEATSAYEREGYGRDVRTFAGYSGADVYGFPGTHVHGDDEDFRGLALRDKYFIDDVPPAPPCEGIGIFLGILFGVEVEDVAELSCPCCADGSSPDDFTVYIDAPDYPDYHGMPIEMHRVTEPFGPQCQWIGEFPEEIEYGEFELTLGGEYPDYVWSGVLEIFDEPEGTILFGLSPTTIANSCDPFVFFYAGLVTEFGIPTSNIAFIKTTPPETDSLDVGFYVGVDVVDVAETIDVGFLVGVELVDLMPPEEVEAGFLFGVEVKDVAVQGETYEVGWLMGIEAVDP